MDSPDHQQTRRGAIATPHEAATRAGADAYAAGGSAIDAAIAAAAALNVVYPHNTALGGDVVALVSGPGRPAVCVNATGWAAAAVDVEDLRRRHGDGMPHRGIDTVTVPGAVRGWQELASIGARLPWGSHLAAAVELAAEGVPVARSLEGALRRNASALARRPELAAAMSTRGKLLRGGELLRQPALADTLRELAETGPSGFYEGPLARSVVTGLGRAGSQLSADDFAAFQAEVVDPVGRDFDGVRVLTSPPNTQGFGLLRALDALRTVADTADPSTVARLAASFVTSNVLRDTVLADPRFNGPGIEELLGVQVPDEHLHGIPRAFATAAGDTVGIAAADDDGWSVSLIQSLYGHFGSHVLDPTTGILFQNRGCSFSLDGRSRNLIAGHKRPSHTLMPVLVERGGTIEAVSSVMGGKAQPQVHAQVLVRSLAGADAAESVGAARWVVGPQDSADAQELVLFEEDGDSKQRAALVAAGFPVRDTTVLDERTGQANLITRRQGRFDAASDPRADGTALVVSLP